MKRLLGVIGILALGACAQTAPPPVATVTPVSAGSASGSAPADPLAGLKAFTLADLAAASADAKAQTPPDLTASQCYDFLIATLPGLPSFTPGQTVGAVVAFQKLRDLNNGATAVNGVLKSLNLACAPLVIDTQTTINKLILMGAGASGFAPGLGALGSLLP